MPGDGFRAWAHERVPMIRISVADFLHCLVIDSIWLERAES